MCNALACVSWCFILVNMSCVWYQSEHWLDCTSLCRAFPLTEAVDSKTLMLATDTGLSLYHLSVSGSGRLLRAQPCTQQHGRNEYHIASASHFMLWALCFEMANSKLKCPHSQNTSLGFFPLGFSQLCGFPPPSITQSACWYNYLVMCLTP